MILDYVSNTTQANPPSDGMTDARSEAGAATLSEVSVAFDGTGAGSCECPFCRRRFAVTSCIEGEGAAEDVSNHLRCNRCGYGWTSRGGEPAKCPKCGSYAWKRPIIECRCNVCNYVWRSRKPGGPARCPNCKSNRWDEVPQITTMEIIDEDAPDVKRKWVLTRYSSGQGCVEIATALGLPIFTVMDIVKDALRSEYNPRL